MKVDLHYGYGRAGVMVKSLGGYSAFVPAKLPPVPPIRIDDEMQNLLSLADRKLGRLDGITQILPNPQLFVAMYVKKEAVLSAQIEGTQASLEDVLNTPIEESAANFSQNGVMEVVNYVNAMYWGLNELNRFPLSLRLIRNIHKILLKDVRGATKNPGEFRTSQNWIGAPNCTLETAAFVPPTVDDMKTALADLEKFIYTDDNIPALIKIALIHAQFETIHPFLDGNGRMGRLLITFWLCQQKILEQPLLYISYFFKQNRQAYYDNLMSVRFKGDWEQWIKFFLKGIAFVSEEATESAKQIIALQQKYTLMLRNKKQDSHIALLEKLFEWPSLTQQDIVKLLNVSSPTAGMLIRKFQELGILQDVTPEKRRNKKYLFGEYFNILQKGTDLVQE